MIRAFSTIAFSLTLTLGLAQPSRFELDFLRSSYVFAEAGVAVPVFDFRVNDLTPSSGYAKDGLAFRLGVGYELGRSVGVQVAFYSASNPFDASTLYADLKGAINGLQKIESDAWNMNGVMLGLFLPLRLPKTTYEVRAAIGYTYCRMGEQRFYIYNAAQSPFPNYQMVFSESESYTPAYQFGFGMRHRLYEKLLLIGKVDFTYAEPLFKNIIITYPPYANRYSADDYRQYMHLLTATIGIAYELE